jgi:hypothetical protein
MNANWDHHATEEVEPLTTNKNWELTKNTEVHVCVVFWN